MPVKTIPLLFIFLLNTGFLMLAAEEKKTDSQAEQKQHQTSSEEKESHYFQDSGSRMDSLVDRIRFKISFSWEKSAEYFHLACSSVKDSAAQKGRDLKAHAAGKKDELMEKGKQTIRETTEQTLQNISEKGGEIKQDLNNMGQEIKADASKEIRENTDKFFK